jgi:hypothetical protein
MNFAMCVAVWFEISGIYKDELSHAGYCVVGDLGYINRWTSSYVLLSCWKSKVYLKMNFAMCVTVWLEISGISVDKLCHVCYCADGDLWYIYWWTSPWVLLWGWISRVFLLMNFAMGVTVRMEISGISVDELSHVCCCGVGDLGYIYRWTWPW